MSHKKKQLTILSLNILAPECLYFFWRSIYGLPIKIAYDNINHNRINNIKNYIKDHKPDIICLQEISNQSYSYLNNMTIQKYIAKETGYIIISESFNKSKFYYDFPPFEQKRTHYTDLGIVTLIKSNNIQFKKNISNANNLGQSYLFKSGDGSPFTVDLISAFGNDFLIANVHIKMNYPNINPSCEEIYQRINHDLNIHCQSWHNMILIGDLNASSSLCDRELNESSLGQVLLNLNEDRDNDHVMIGKTLLDKQYKINYWFDYNMPLLKMNVDTPPISNLWQMEDIKYKVNHHNHFLISNNLAISTHKPLHVQIVL